MPATIAAAPEFVDRREPTAQNVNVGCERRQFANSHDHLSSEAAEMARAIDQYKLQHRRRFVNFEEMLSIFKSLGYHKS